MVLKIDSKYEARLREIADASGRTLEELIEDTFERIIDEASPQPPERISSQQHAAMMENLDRIRSMPRKSPDDGFTARDLDKILYGKDW